MNKKALIKRAKQKSKALKKKKKDARFIKTLGKLKKEGFIDTNEVHEFSGMVFLNDAIWASTIEPRILELLPAIIVKKPGVFSYLKLPDDLEQIVKEIKTGQLKSSFRTVPAKQIEKWIPIVGKKGSFPSIMKTFRLTREDLALLSEIQSDTGESQTTIIRRALQNLKK